MRQRLPIFLVALMILPALFVAGCGDDEEPAATTPAPTQTTAAPTGATGATSGESATESAQRNLDNCLKGAEQLPDDSAKDAAKKQCQAAYDNIKDATKKVDESVDEARKNCEQAAQSIPNEEAKANALEACKKFQ